jgi:cell shape-determining protein MreC
MKKGSYRRSSGLSLGVQPIGVFIIVLVLLVALVRFTLPGFFITLSTPFWRAGSVLTMATEDFLAVFEKPAALVDARDSALQSAQALQNQNQVLAAKVADLTHLLGSRVEVPQGIVAAVLVRPPVSPYDTLVVDQGTASGVVPHATVYGPGGIAIGSVDSVTQRAARITLYSSSGKTVSALVGVARVPITLTGAGAGTFDASAPRESGIIVGDQVFVGGPGSLPVGTISAIDSDPASPIETLHVRPLAQPFSLTWVTISPQALVP